MNYLYAAWPALTHQLPSGVTDKWRRVSAPSSCQLIALLLAWPGLSEANLQPLDGLIELIVNSAGQMLIFQPIYIVMAVALRPLAHNKSIRLQPAWPDSLSLSPQPRWLRCGRGPGWWGGVWAWTDWPSQWYTSQFGVRLRMLLFQPASRAQFEQFEHFN